MANFLDQGFKVKIRPYLDGQAGIKGGGRLATSFPGFSRRASLRARSRALALRTESCGWDAGMRASHALGAHKVNLEHDASKMATAVLLAKLL